VNNGLMKKEQKKESQGDPRTMLLPPKQDTKVKKQRHEKGTTFEKYD
jgi:hypothetical protein